MLGRRGCATPALPGNATTAPLGKREALVVPGWLLALLIALGLFYLLRALFHRPDPVQVWQGLAEATGLHFDPGVGATAAGPSLRGTFREVDVRLSVEPPARGSSQRHTVAQAAIPLPGTTGVWGAATHRLVDGQDPWTRPGRDHLALTRRSNSPSVVAALDRPEVRDLADAFLSHHPSARIADDWVTVSVPGMVTDARQLGGLLSEVASTALAFRDAGDLDGASEQSERQGTPEPTATGAPPPFVPGAGQTPGSPSRLQPQPPEAHAGPGRPNPYAPPSAALVAPPAPTPAPVDPDVVAQWRRRAAVAYFLGLLPAGMGVCLAVVGGLLVSSQLYGLPGSAWIAIGGGLFGVGLLLFGRAYRCPACGAFLRSPRSGNIVFDPKHCPHCGATLRE